MSTRPVTVAAVRQDAAAAETCHAVVRRALTARPGTMVVVDSLPIGGGYDGVRAWAAKHAQAHRSTGRLVVHPEIRADEAVALLQGGAHGVVADQSPGWLIRHAVGVVSGGGLFLDPWLMHDVADMARPDSGNLADVTGAEQRVLVRAARGLAPEDIAGDLRVGRDVVMGHLRALHARLGGTRAELVAAAQASGLLPSGRNRSTASAWETTRGLHGLAVFVVGGDDRSRGTVVGAVSGAGAHVVGEGGNEESLRATPGQWHVTIALSRPADRDLRAIRTARPRAALVVLPWVIDAGAVDAALAARAQGVVGVDARLAQLVVAIRSAAAGGLYLSSPALRRVIAAVNPNEGLLTGALTERQLEVLALAGRGYPNRQIAEVLGIAEATVKGHLRHALRALQSTSRGEAATRARRLGLIDAR